MKHTERVSFGKGRWMMSNTDWERSRDRKIATLEDRVDSNEQSIARLETAMRCRIIHEETPDRTVVIK